MKSVLQKPVVKLLHKLPHIYKHYNTKVPPIKTKE